VERLALEAPEAACPLSKENLPLTFPLPPMALNFSKETPFLKRDFWPISRFLDFSYSMGMYPHILNRT
jgi:hypothetical protein